MNRELKFKFNFFEFDYLAPIYVQNIIINKNTGLHLEWGEGLSLKFTSLFSFNHYNIYEWKFIILKFFNENTSSHADPDFSRPYFNLIKNPTVYHTGELLFIIESILLENLMKNQKEIVFKIFKISPPVPLVIAKLLLPTFHLAQNTSQELKCVKIKIRPGIKSMEFVQRILDQLSNDFNEVQIRFDGNRSFELDELISFFNGLQIDKNKIKVEYIEEPLRNMSNYFIFFKFYPIPLALDESAEGFLEKNIESLKEISHLSTVVLRPSLLGISKTFRIIDELLKHNLTPVLSSSYEFEGPMLSYYLLASKCPNVFHGLDTLKFIPLKYLKQVPYFKIE